MTHPFHFTLTRAAQMSDLYDVPGLDEHRDCQYPTDDGNADQYAPAGLEVPVNVLLTRTTGSVGVRCPPHLISPHGIRNHEKGCYERSQTEKCQSQGQGEHNPFRNQKPSANDQSDHCKSTAVDRDRAFELHDILFLRGSTNRACYGASLGLRPCPTGVGAVHHQSVHRSCGASRGVSPMSSVRNSSGIRSAPATSARIRRSMGTPRRSTLIPPPGSCSTHATSR